MEHDPQRLFPDFSWAKPLAEKCMVLADEATHTLVRVNEKMDAFREDRLALIGGLWLGGVTVAVVMLTLFCLNLARRK